MRKYIFLFILGGLIIATHHSYAQVDSLAKATAQYKKFHWGIHFNNYWSSIEGSNVPEYFYKPSLGYFIKAEYYFTNMLGISAGIGLQQRGAGIINRNQAEVPLGGRDSTYRERLRMNYIDVPVMLSIRNPQPIKGGDVRLAGSFGIVPQYMVNTTQIFHSVEDGFHEYINQTDNLTRMDLGLIASAGVDIFAGSTVFQVRLVGNWGTRNVYNNAVVYPGYSGKNRMYGIQVGFMF